MRINYNATAMLAVNALNKNDENLSVSTGKLSSGYKINRAKDNPSGYAMSRKMHAQLVGLMQARDNSDTGVNILKAVDGALSEVHDMLQRINELAIKGANGTLSDGDRALVDEEVQKLKEEIQRVSETFEFNGQKLLDGSFQLKGYTDNVDVKVWGYSERIERGTYVFDLTDFLNENNNYPGSFYNDEGYFRHDIIEYDNDGKMIPKPEIPEIKVYETDENGNKKATPMKDISVSKMSGTVMTLVGPNGFEINLDIREEYTKQTPLKTDIKIELTGYGPMEIQVGANEGQDLAIEIPEVGIKGLGIQAIHTKSKDGSLDAITKVSAAIDKLSGIRSKIGAYQNRLESIVTSNEINHENMTAAFSNIMDTDMSEEYTTYSTYQILSQASTSVLAQANERPSKVLQLLQ